MIVEALIKLANQMEIEVLHMNEGYDRQRLLADVNMFKADVFDYQERQTCKNTEWYKQETKLNIKK